MKKKTNLTRFCLSYLLDAGSLCRHLQVTSHTKAESESSDDSIYLKKLSEITSITYNNGN
jgi:hypothetical protein